MARLVNLPVLTHSSVRQTGRCVTENKTETLAMKEENSLKEEGRQSHVGKK